MPRNSDADDDPRVNAEESGDGGKVKNHGRDGGTGFGYQAKLGGGGNSGGEYRETTSGEQEEGQGQGRDGETGFEYQAEPEG